MVRINELGHLGAMVDRSMQAQVVAKAAATAQARSATSASGLPQAIVNSSSALKQRAGITAARAKAAEKASLQKRAVAQQAANAARAQLGVDNKQAAGAKIVQHLTALREAVVAQGEAIKLKRTATVQAQAAQKVAVAENLREAANTARATGNVIAAQQLSARADVADRQKQLAVQAAETIASTPLNLPMPAELTEAAITEAGARYAIRVTRRDAQPTQMANRALIAVLGDIDRNEPGFRNPAAVLAAYGGGPVGMAFAGAEMGNLQMYSRGVGALGDWFTDALKAVGKGVGLDVDSIEKGFNDVGATISSVVKQGEEFVKNASAAFNPPQQPAVKSSVTQQQAQNVVKSAQKSDSMPSVSLPTTAPTIKDKIIGTTSVPSIPQNIVKPQAPGYSTGMKVAFGVGAVGVGYAILRALRG